MLREVLASAAEIEHADLEGYASGYLGALCMERGGRDEEAREALLVGLGRVPDVGHRALFQSYFAALEARTGSLEHARQLWEMGRREAVPAVLRAAVELQVVHLDLAESRQASARGDEATAAAAYARASAKLGETASSRGDALYARRVAASAFERRREPSTPPPGTSDLYVQEEGNWFRVGAGRKVDCSKFGLVRRALVCVADAHARQPGVAVPWEEMVNRVWPNEAISDAAAKNRLRVTIAKLRRLGLQELLVTEACGYRLDERVVLRIE